MATDPARTRGGGPADRIRGFGDSSSTETKAAFKTTELIAYVAVLVAILIAGAVAGTDEADALNADEVWLFATLLTIGYMISRGLAKSGSRDPYSRDDGQR